MSIDLVFRHTHAHRCIIIAYAFAIIEEYNMRTQGNTKPVSVSLKGIMLFCQAGEALGPAQTLACCDLLGSAFNMSGPKVVEDRGVVGVHCHHCRWLNQP